jgi:O-acetyl-ADP-ribose deacetylase (regulator of RNase III)
MEQQERRVYLIKELLSELPGRRRWEIPEGETEQRRMLRSLLNIRFPKPTGQEFLRVQDEYLQRELQEKGITALSSLTPVKGDLYVWQGDITTLQCDGIVNAANSKMLGCFCACHACIDNAIHTFAGVQLRAACAEIMEKQGHDEPTGQAKITPAFNLPCKYVLHTVGPVIYGELQEEDKALLASCYRSCLSLADENGLKSIAFCCISTGEFHFPNRAAAEIAVRTVTDYKRETKSKIKVVFNVFKSIDREIYEELLG